MRVRSSHLPAREKYMGTKLESLPLVSTNGAYFTGSWSSVTGKMWSYYILVILISAYLFTVGLLFSYLCV